MNIIEINQISDLNIILENDIVITHNLALQEKEISSNMWGISLSDNFSRKLVEIDIVKFVQQLIDLRQEQVNQNIIQPTILFYLWFDELALQLRFNFVSGCADQLPFTCSVKYLDLSNKIINQFVTATWPDREANMAGVTENEKDYVVEVFRKCIQKSV